MLSNENLIPPSFIEHLDELRSNYECYAFFCTHVLPIVAEVKMNKTGYKEKVQDIVTLNDEAFGLLCLHNGWEYWEEQAQYIKTHEYNRMVVSKSYQASLPNDQRIVWKNKPKYTMTTVELERVETRFGVRPKRIVVNKCIKTWNDKGRMKFLTLGAMLIDDRIENSNFDSRYFRENNVPLANRMVSLTMNHDDFAGMNALMKEKRGEVRIRNNVDDDMPVMTPV